MLQPNINAKQFKEVFYDSSLQPSATSVNITVENCHVNAYIEQIVLTFASSDSTAGNISCTLLDRGNSYTGSINGYNPITFAVIGYNTSPVINQNVITNTATTQTIIYVNESVQDSEGIGNIYVKLTKSSGTFNVNFTMTVIYRPESTYNPRFDNLNQIGNRTPQRVLSQVGLGTYFDAASVMTDQTNFLAHRVNPRNNLDIVSYGFNVFSTSPIFYFGTPTTSKRWFIGFGSDCTPNLGIVTFSYFNGTNFVALASTQVFNGAAGPGTYVFAYDGVLIINPPSTWSALVMPNDPLTIYNNNIIGLGTLRSNNVVNNPNMYWIQCQVGFSVTSSLRISTIQPLLATDHPLTVRRRLLG